MILEWHMKHEAMKHMEYLTFGEDELLGRQFDDGKTITFGIS